MSLIRHSLARQVQQAPILAWAFVQAANMSRSRISVLAGSGQRAVIVVYCGLASAWFGGSVRGCQVFLPQSR